MRENAVVSALPILNHVFNTHKCVVEFFAEDGQHLQKNESIACIRGPLYDILARERIALNFLQRLSGIATLTARYVEAVKDTDARIVDTRKTLPGWRALDKYAVRCGGGVNHRFSLADMIMIKDNHWADAHLSPAEYIAIARNYYPNCPVACEADSVEMALKLITLNIDLLMCDNMSLDELSRIVNETDGRVAIEATGGVTLDSVARIAHTGVNRISVGALTHSAPAVDIAFDSLSNA